MRILFIDDSPLEVEKIQRQLQNHGLHVSSERVDTDQGMQAALDQQDWDLILANLVARNLDGMRALYLAKQNKPAIPFIMLANKLEEEAIVQAVKAGADNFVVNHDFPRLLELIGQINPNGKENKKIVSQPPLEGNDLTSLIQEKQFLESILTSIQDGILVLDNELTVQMANPIVVSWFPEKAPLVGKKCYEVFHKADKICDECPNLLTLSTGTISHEIISRNDEQTGLARWLESSSFPFHDLKTGNIKGIVNLISDITNRKQVEDETRRLNNKLRSIALSTRQMSSLLDVDLLAEQVVHSLNEITGCYTANLFIIENNELKLIASYGGFADSQAPIGVKLPLKEGIIAYVARTGQTLLVPDVSQDARFLFWKDLPDTKAELAVPIKNNERILGVLDMQDSIPYAFDLTDMEAMQIFADQLAVAMENAQLFKKIGQRTRELEMIARVSAALRVAASRKEMLPVILDQLSSLLAIDCAGLTMVDESNNDLIIELAQGAWKDYSGLRYTPESVNECPLPLKTNLYLNNKILTDPVLPKEWVEKSLQSVAAAPLIAQGVTIGSLWIGTDSEISDDQIQLLAAIADITANAIHRATLHEQTQRRLLHISALQKIDLTIATSFDLNITFNVLLTEVISQLGVDAADILILNPYLRSLDFAAGQGFHSNKAKNTHLYLGQGYAGKIALERRAIYLADLIDIPDSSLDWLGFEEHFTSYFGVPLLIKGQVKGVLEVFNRTPFRPDEEWLNFLNTLAGQAAIAVDNITLFENLQQTNTHLILAYDATIEGWSRALDLRDEDTEGHTQRVTNITLRLCEVMGINKAEQVHIRRGALLHDIGKMGIPDNILLKPGPLSREEWVIMQKHPVLAYEFLSPISFLRPALDIPYCHHERWDGTGYPRGIKGEQIPIAARIFTIADVWDALSSNRPYRPAWDEELIITYIEMENGRHFDPLVVETFLALYRNNQLFQRDV